MRSPVDLIAQANYVLPVSDVQFCDRLTELSCAQTLSK